MSYLDVVFSARHALSTKLDVDCVGSHHLWCEQQTEGSVGVLHDVDIDVVPAGTTDAAGDLALTGLGGVDANNGLFVDWYCGVFQTFCNTKRRSQC